MTPQQIHHARIMIEGGCSIEDVTVTLGIRLIEAMYAVAPSIKTNPKEQKRVRRILHGMKMPPAIFHVVHRGRGGVESVESCEYETRIAA